MLAGTAPDLDGLSVFAGPAAYIRWHHTYTHSLAAAFLICIIATAVYVVQKPNGHASIPASSATIACSLFAVTLIHVALDACQSDGIAILWPFTSRRLAGDLLAHIDPWIIAMLAAAILLPELLRLVSAEIGSKDKSPRGRFGAAFGLLLILVYIGSRATLHSNVIATVEARSYRGESPRRVAAFPEAVSPFNWQAIVETDRALYELTVNEMPGASFDPEAAVVLFKPEPSPILEAARQSPAAKTFLSVARFPKASIEKTLEGYRVQLRDLRYAALSDIQHEIAVLVETDPMGSLRSADLVWASDLRGK
jgi:membrane-bound metal-dependent hydrolase YbcI (DUF457 family)